MGMYLPTTQRCNGDGWVVRYVQLAHNRRVGGVLRFGCWSTLDREEQLARDEVARLVASIVSGT